MSNMAEKYLIDKDPITGEECYAHFDDEGNVRIEHLASMEDVKRILEWNKEKAKDDEATRRGMKEDWWHYARIPNIVALKWMNEHGVNIYDRNHQKAMFRLLNSPEYRFLKTTDKVHA